MSREQQRRFSLPENDQVIPNMSFTIPIHQNLDEDEEFFLRSDVNQLFNNMMISSNFNSKKLHQSKELETKKNTKRQSANGPFQPSQRQRKHKKITTEPADASNTNEGIFVRNKKHQTMADWNFTLETTKKQFLKTENLNRIMKKRDNAAFANGNKDLGSKSVKINNGGGITSTYVSQKKGEENESEFTSTKYIPQSKLKTMRRKVMSLTSKGNKMPHLETETMRDDNQSLMKSKVSNKRIQTQNPVVSIPGQKGQRKNKYRQLQKKYNKGGPLKFKHVQNWLNNIIQQYCHDQYFDTSLTSAALKKYYIDSNSLMSNGVDPADVSRIYNSLFVYSIGFNNLIKQISKGNRELVKNIWKVYSLLLEYCAAGNYETLVGEIQRDKLRKVEELKMEIERRQEIIQKNEQLNEQKNMTMYKQLKRLKDENFNLANQREILMEDFQQADQAFNEEVSLRLKFQNTINQIYGVHKQLQNKHGRLYHDFQAKMEELKRASEKYFEQSKISQKYKYELLDLKQKWNELNKINTHDKQHIEVLLQELAKMKENYFLNFKELEQAKYLMVEKDRKLEQMQTELQNNKIIVELREKSAKETHAEYQITLEENNKLFAVISQQRVNIQALLKQKKQFNQNVLKILADSTYYKKKHETAEIQIKNLNEKLSQAESSLHKTSVQSDILQKELETYKNDLQSNYENIKKMHTRNFELQEELSYLRKFQGNMDSVMGQKNALIQQLKDKVQSLQKRLLSQTHQFMTLQSKYKILDAQYRAQKQLSLKRVQEFRKQQDLMCINESSLSKLLKQANNQLDKYKTMWNNTLMDLKNEKFQRSNLNLNYEQILKVVEKKNVEEKLADIKINQLKEEVLEVKEKYKKTYLNLVSTTEELNLKIAHRNQTIVQQKLILDHKAHHYHPMLYEDLIHRYQLQIQAHQRTRQNFWKKLQTAAKEKSQLEKSMKRQKGQLQHKMDKMEKDFKKVQEKLKEELEFLKGENQTIKKRINALQILQATYKEKVKLYAMRQDQQKRINSLLQEINQKNVKIANLFQEIQRIHDLKRDEISGLKQQIKKAQDEKVNFIYEFKTKKQREIQEQLDQKYRQIIDNLKQQYEQKLKSPTHALSSIKNNSQDAQAFNLYFRQIIKDKSLEEILQIKKEQLEAVNEPENNKFFDQIESFFKQSANGKNIQILNRTNYFGSENNTTQKDFNKTAQKQSKEKPMYLQRLETQDMRRRAAITRKLKIAHDYYNKN